MTSYPAGWRNSLTDVPGVRVSHLTLVRTGDDRPVRTGLTAIFTSPVEGNVARPAAIVTLGGRTDVAGLNFVTDFGLLPNSIVATSMRSLGRVYDAMLTRLGWPPIVAGLDDGRLSDQRRVMFADEDVARTLDEARDDKVPEGAVGAAAGLVAFGYKSGVGSASRQVVADTATYVVGALALLNLGRRDTLRVGGAAVAAKRQGAPGPPALRGSALIVVVTNAPLDDRQCRHLGAVSLQGLARLGVVPAAREGLVACAISTGVQLVRNDPRASQIEVPYSSEMTLGSVSAAVADAAEEASVRTLTMVKTEQGTAQYPALPASRARQLTRSLAR